MGNKAGSELSCETVENIRRSTAFNARQIPEMYERFMADFPEGAITPAHFVDKYSATFSQGDAEKLARYVFRAYDVDGNGRIDFGEYARAMDVAVNGDEGDALRWAFHLYDLDGDGQVTRGEATELLVAIYQLRGIKNAAAKAEVAVREIFNVLQKNYADVIHETEFVSAIKRSKRIRNLFQANA